VLSCRFVRRRLSAHRDGELGPEETRRVAAHLSACAACAARWRGLGACLDLLGDSPRIAPPEPVAGRILDRLELETRGPGLALLFRSPWRARPLILPSLVPAALVLVTVLAAALALVQNPGSVPRAEELASVRVPPWGSEANPLFPSQGVSTPQVRSRAAIPDAFSSRAGEGSLFVETVVARDGSVSTVTLLNGDSEAAAPILAALRLERFEPARYRGRPVAVSLYRLISRLEVLAPAT
jgi:Putative zinc-finger